MTCRAEKLGEATVIVCGRSMRHQIYRCVACLERGRVAEGRWLCDYPTAQGETCSKAACAAHKREIEPGRDHCVEHPNNPKSCWSCKSHQIVGEAFLGKCRWPIAKGRPAREIPPHIVDVGCPMWVAKEST